MRFNYKLLLGLVCILLGVALIIYAEYTLHHHVAHTKPFFEKVKDFFVHIGNMLTGTAKPVLAPPTNQKMKTVLISGVILTCFGIIMTIFNRIKRK